MRKDAELISLVLGIAIYGNNTDAHIVGLMVFKKVVLNLFKFKKELLILLKNFNIISLKG